ncbi:MAG TPA: hypothetical protein PKK39_02370 [Tepidiformaceae bacterium]|nr:hypothetical protein [Tepidiformaceae bacterium]
MAHHTRRIFLPTALLLLIMLIAAGSNAMPVSVKAVFDPNGPAFDPLSTYDTSTNPVEVKQPPALLAGTVSHRLPASAATRNGYCVDVNIDGIEPVGGPTGDMGFRITATEPIDPNAPPLINVLLPAGATYVDGFVAGASVSSLNAGVGSTADDVYCVVPFAPDGYKKLHVSWAYLDTGGVQQVITLPDIPIRTVTLDKIGNGLVGAPAEVCTVGWDSTFLTGRTSNAGGLSGTNPDPVNKVVPADFVVTGAMNGIVTVDYVRQVGPEWCAGIASTTNEDNLQVTFNFDAVYNRVTTTTRDNDEDDQPVPVSPQLPADRLVDIRDIVELRHVTMDGEVPPRQSSGPLVINSPHYICLIGTDGTVDSLLANQIHFQPASPPDAPGAGNIQVFTKTAANNPRLGGVANNTLCFVYTSASPGEQTVWVNFTNNGIADQAFFDSDGDGNGVTSAEGIAAGPLVTEWNTIDRTVLSNGNSFTEGVVTYGEIDVPLQFNLADGTFIGSTSVTEWVLGKHKTAGKDKTNQLLDGVLIRAEIVGNCGYFVVPDDSQPKVITGVSIGGLLDLNNFTSDPFAAFGGDTNAGVDSLEISTLNGGGCGTNEKARVRVNVYYPNATDTPAAPEEWVDLTYSFIPAMKVPTVAWAGQIVPITYAISSNTSCTGQTVQFVRPKGQPGTFLAGPGVTLNGPDHATMDLGSGCSATIRYESEDPGEVDVEMFIQNNNYTKIARPIFFLVFEDISVEATPDQFVSTFGDATASVRGYFVGTNPSGRPEEKKADGRTVPKDRWILPTDWELLKGQSNLRNPWGSIQMPAAIVSFFMQDESVLNNYKASVKKGASGFFIPDSVNDYSFNVHPTTKVPSALGSVRKPRIMSQPSETDGTASVDTFGDFNLSYEDCVANAINKNPQCKPEDIAGRTRYYATVEYPQDGNRGKFPAIASNVVETVWRWAGYKDVTVVSTDSPQIKYVVAHLRDRDGFCDAANYNNTLGVPVRFEIDAGGGVIIDAADQPYTINGTRRFATATTFDTLDVNGRPLNAGIAKPPLIAEQPDECQAWIKVSNSLLQPTNVTVTFPAPPSPVPGDIRITNLQCTGQETITVKNFGSNVVNLGGFALKSAGTDVGIAEELDLIGVLGPGESKTFVGGPGAATENWIGTQSEVFSGSSDFASVVWEDFALSTMFCDGTSLTQAPPASFPPDGEGEIVMDIVVQFGNENDIPLIAGWNLVPTGAGTVKIADAFAGHESDVVAVYAWDSTLQEWRHYIPGIPPSPTVIDEIGNGLVLWVLVKQPFTLTLPK